MEKNLLGYCGVCGTKATTDRKDLILELVASGSGPWHLHIGFLCLNCMALTHTTYSTKTDPRPFIKQLAIYSTEPKTFKHESKTD